MTSGRTMHASGRRACTGSAGSARSGRSRCPASCRRCAPTSNAVSSVIAIRPSRQVLGEQTCRPSARLAPPVSIASCSASGFVTKHVRRAQRVGHLTQRESPLRLAALIQRCRPPVPCASARSARGRSWPTRRTRGSLLHASPAKRLSLTGSRRGTGSRQRRRPGGCHLLQRVELPGGKVRDRLRPRRSRRRRAPWRCRRRHRPPATNTVCSVVHQVGPGHRRQRVPAPGRGHRRTRRWRGAKSTRPSA